MADHDTLYQETLTNAQTEIRELAVEIEHLRELLVQLERRKKAVEEICSAIRCWVEVTGENDGPDIPPSTPSLLDQEGTVALTEEEVVLIAYPNGTSKTL